MSKSGVKERVSQSVSERERASENERVQRQ